MSALEETAAELGFSLKNKIAVIKVPVPQTTASSSTENLSLELNLDACVRSNVS